MSSSNLNNKHTARFNQRKRAYLKRTNRYRRPCIEQLETRRLLVNEIPTLDFINDSTIAEDAPQQTVNLSGITAGVGESQTLRVSATSSNTALIQNPSVAYTSANTTGSIAFTPIADKSGTSVITVTVEDAGLDNDLNTSADNATFSRSFTVTVNPVNDIPTLNHLVDYSDYSNPVTYPVNTQPESLDYGDIDKDGDIDLVAMARATGKIYVYINNGKGTFTLGSLFDTTPGAPGALSIKLNDIDGDSDLDLLLSNNVNGGKIRVYNNNGSGVFALGSEINMSSITPILPVVVDLNKDGLTDLITANFNGNSISVALRQNGTNFAGANVYPLTDNASSNPYNVHPVDLDNDGYLDLVIPTSAGGSTVILYNLGDGTFGRKSVLNHPGYAMASTMVDVDKDGDLDLLQAETWGSGKINLLKNNGAGSLVFAGSWFDLGNCRITHITHADTDGDGSENVVVTTAEAGVQSIASVNTTLTATPLLSGSYPNLLYANLADFNADGSLDIASISQSDNYIVVRNTIPKSITIAEDAPQQTVNLTGITAGGGESQPLKVTATCDKPSIIPNPSVSYTSANTTGWIAFTPIANQFGTAVITVSVEDSGLDNDLATTADNATFSRYFTVTVTPVNDTPTLDAISNVTIAEDAPQQTVNLTGITAGGGESQTLRVSATSSNTALIPNPGITYTSANPTGSIAFTPVADKSGTSVITIIVEDAGLDNDLATSADNLSYSRSFTVTVNPVNDLPTLDVIANMTISEDAAKQTINLSGITAGGAESQALRVTVSSSNRALIPIPTVTYTTPNATGSIAITPIVDQWGKCAITVTVEDAGLDSDLATSADNATFSRTFTVTVNPVNDIPTLNAINNVIISEDAPQQTVNLTAITAGGGESQTLRVSATSSNTAIIANPSVSYTSANTTGSIAFTPITDKSGTSVITVTVEDAGLDNDLATTADNAILSRSFTVTVTPVNDTPTLDAISNATIALDAPQQTVNLTGITAGGSESQTLRVSATSSNTSLIPNPGVTYTSANPTGSIAFTPIADKPGTSIITVTVEDAGLDNDLATSADNASFSRSFTVTVNPVNDTPTLNTINNVTIAEDAPQQTVNLTGINAGGGESQPLKVTASSDKPSLIPNPSVSYTSANTTGSIAFTPIADQYGTAVLMVFVEDGGLDGDLTTTADNAIFSRSFTVTVTPVNDAPTLDMISNITIAEDAPQQTVSLAGITAGGGETQPIRITGLSSDVNLIPNPTINYTSPNQIGSLSFAPAADKAGIAVITLLVEDGGLDGDLVTLADNSTVTRSFVIDVSSINDAPTLDAIADLAISEDTPQRTISLKGITAGGGEIQPLRVLASSSNASLIPIPSINYTSANPTGFITINPVPDKSGTSTIIVTIEDGGLDGDIATSFDNAIFARSFSVIVTPVNDTPTIDSISKVRIAEDAPQQTIAITGITAGGGESQPLHLSVSSSNPNLIPTPAIQYTSPNSVGTMTFTPVADLAGVSVITILVEDGGLDGDLATGGDNSRFGRSFTITVDEVNDIPTLASISDRVLDEDNPEQSLNLFGISAGGNESQPLLVTAVSSNPTVVAVPQIDYTSPNSTGILRLIPKPNQFGSSEITVTVMDGGLDGDITTTHDNASVKRSFTVSVRPLNDPPTANPIPNQSIEKNGSNRQLQVSGISSGPNETQPVRLQVVGGQSLLESLSVTYIAGSDTAFISYKPLADRLGSTKITLTLEDGGLDGDLASTFDNAITAIQFTITVYAIPVAQPDSAITTYDAAVTIPVLRNDSDEDGNLVNGSIRIETAPLSGVLTLNPNGSINYIPSTSFRGLDTFAYSVEDDNGYRSNPADVQVRVVTSFYQNYRNRFDVDDDLTVSPLDVLVLINDINAFGSRVLAPNAFTPPPYIDVNGDRRVDPLDVLEVINYLNSSKNGEGESSTENAALELPIDAATTDQAIAALYLDETLDPLTGRTRKRGI